MKHLATIDDAARRALATGWADHRAGRARWRGEWAKLADLCNPRQCLLTPPGQPVPLILTADGARGFYLLGLAGLDEPELSRQALLDAVYFLSQTGPGRSIDQDLVPGCHADIPADNLAWLRERGLWDGPAPAPPAEVPADPPGAVEPEPDEPGPVEVEQTLSGAEEDSPPPGLVLPCSVCRRLPGTWHKCCPACAASADGEPEIERLFGFRTLRGRRAPQTWCRHCRAHPPGPQAQLALGV